MSLYNNTDYFLYFTGAPVGGTGLTQAHIRCSDPNVICDSKGKQPGEPIDVNLKVSLIVKID